MKKNILKSLLLTAVVSTVGIGSVFAADDRDYEPQSSNVADYNLNIFIKDKLDVTANAYLEIKGLKTDSVHNNYYVKFVEKDAAKPAEIKQNSFTWQTGLGPDSYITFDETTDGRNIASISDEIYLYNRDFYVYVYNCTKIEDGYSYCKVTTDKPIKVEKEAMPNLTERYKLYFFGNDGSTDVPHASVFPLFPNYYDDEIKIPLNVKVGLIEDSSVIRAMAKNESGAKQKLYDYAKNATNGLIYSGELKDFHGIDISNLTVQDGKYYYVYFEVEDPTNKYIDMTDATIVMGEYGYLVNDVKYGDYDDIDYKDYDYGCYACTNDYVWTVKGYQASTCKLVDSITSKGNCVKSVKTGVEDYLVPGAIVMVVGGAIVTLLSKKSKFKRI